MKSESRTPCILIADDQADVLEALRFLIKGEGYTAVAVTSPGAVIAEVESRDFDAVLMDLNYTRDTTSGQEGLDLLHRIQMLDTTLPVIVMTAWGSVELAVEAMRRGARDFIQKPWDNARLSAILKTQIELGRALRKGQGLEAENRALRAERFPQLIAGSAAMRPVLDVISRVGPSDANVLTTGENGTGKGLLAQTLHSVSLRSTRPLVTVNTIAIRLPPLRDRCEDLPVLAAHFLRQHAAHYRKPLTGFDEGAIKALLGHGWPGNVRELGHAVERAVLMAQGDIIRAADLGLRAGREGPPRLEEMSLEDVEALLIKKALARFSGNVSHAANALGLSRSALYRRLQRYGL